MNLTHEFIVRSMISVLQSHLGSVLSSQYKNAFSRAKKDLIKRGLCESVSLNMQDENTLIINITKAGVLYVLLWDIRSKKIQYARRRRVA